VAPHNPNGPICTIASIHACLSIPNFLILEFFEPDEAVFREIVVGGLRRDQEAVYPLTAPGLGINITEDFLRKHRFDEIKTNEMELRTFNTVR
jgi:galactonate dehydratase